MNQFNDNKMKIIAKKQIFVYIQIIELSNDNFS